jgi:CxxC motif-containing protein (DUF1111 family)
MSVLCTTKFRVVALVFAIAAVAAMALAQTPTPSNAAGTASQALDPGVRKGAPGAGGPLANLGPYASYFQAALTRFQEVDSVTGNQPGSNGSGLGPRFNADSCAECHAQPAIGGSSPAVNPQVAGATVFNADNQVPPFVTSNGPVREARFIRNPDGSPDGGVHDLYTITGMSDAPNCKIQQPNFAQALAQNNVIFRIPTPVFGAGLVEQITDTNILAGVSVPIKAVLGISGQPNLSGNDGTVTRFGWKAQNKSLLMFAGEAYNVEQGVTNLLFPNERDETPGCLVNPLPEDNFNTSDESSGVAPPMGYAPDIENFAMFMRLSAPPAPVSPLSGAAQFGSQIFNMIGCAMCHTPTLKTGSTSTFTNAQNQAVNAFSDFLLHHMGQGLADNVSQGLATGDQFRTAPLWGVGQRIFFLHDGRTNNLVGAIEAHRSSGSEANQVINNFNQLSAGQAEALLQFLRSL